MATEETRRRGNIRDRAAQHYGAFDCPRMTLTFARKRVMVLWWRGGRDTYLATYDETLRDPGSAVSTLSPTQARALVVALNAHLGVPGDC